MTEARASARLLLAARLLSVCPQVCRARTATPSLIILPTVMLERSSAVLTVVVVVVVSLVLTQLLLACLQRKRLQRIEEKSLSLCTKAEPGARQVPITIVTGFLGSGKTTLVNRVLTADHGKRIVVIENELGSVSIDHSLIDEARQKVSCPPPPPPRSPPPLPTPTPPPPPLPRTRRTVSSCSRTDACAARARAAPEP